MPRTAEEKAAPRAPTGDGYWLTAADGGLFTYGRAPFMGSAATLPRSHPVVGLALFAPAA